MVVNPMKFVVLMVIVDENVYRNFGCVMVIGKKQKQKERMFEISLMINSKFFFSDCDDGSDEDARYCGMLK